VQGEVFQVYIDLRSKSNGKNDASRHIVMGIHDLHGNEVVVGLYWGFTCKWRMDQPGFF
jgi:hypothetical protein